MASPTTFKWQFKMKSVGQRWIVVHKPRTGTGALDPVECTRIHHWRSQSLFRFGHLANINVPAERKELSGDLSWATELVLHARLLHQEMHEYLRYCLLCRLLYFGLQPI